MMPLAGSCIKPLLSVPKKELKEFMQQRNFDWREDSSNFEREYTRNIVRLDLVPLLQELAGGEEALHRRVVAIGDQSHQLRELLDREAQQYFNQVNSTPSSFLVVPCRSERTFLLTEAFFQLPALSQADILHSWIASTTKDTPSYQLIRKLLGFIVEDERSPSSKPSRLIDMSEKWYVSKVGRAVKVINKQLRSIADSHDSISTTRIGDTEIRFIYVGYSLIF